MEVKLKEKEQEAKLSELKVRELKKSLPNNRLKPLMKPADSIHMSDTLDPHKQYTDDYLYQHKPKYDITSPLVSRH